MEHSVAVGHDAEQTARHHLQKHGLKLLTRNFRSRYGEIDLIMQDQDYLVFVEVRLRNNNAYGGGIESVDFRKQQKIIKTAEFYLQRNKKLLNNPCRFDVVSINQSKADIDWIKNAFQDETGY